MRVNLDELYVICRENDYRVMHSGHYSHVTPKFYPKGHANAPCEQLNKQFESMCRPFNESIYDRQYFTEEAVRGFALRHAKAVAEEMRLGAWIVRVASDILMWKH